MTARREGRVTQGTRRRAKGGGGRRGPLSCSVHGPGLDVEIRIANTSGIGNLLKVFTQGFREGAAILMMQAPAHIHGQDAGRVDDQILRQAVAADLRKMWDAMWKHGPASEDAEDRDAQFGAWIMGPVGQSIIDEALSEEVSEHEGGEVAEGARTTRTSGGN